MPDTPLRESHDVGIVLQHKIERLEQVRLRPLARTPLAPHPARTPLARRLHVPYSHAARTPRRLPSARHPLAPRSPSARTSLAPRSLSLITRSPSARTPPTIRPHPARALSGRAVFCPRRLPAARRRRSRPPHTPRIQDAGSGHVAAAAAGSALTTRRGEAQRQLAGWRRGIASTRPRHCRNAQIPLSKLSIRVTVCPSPAMHMPEAGPWRVGFWPCWRLAVLASGR